MAVRVVMMKVPFVGTYSDVEVPTECETWCARTYIAGRDGKPT